MRKTVREYYEKKNTEYRDENLLVFYQDSLVMAIIQDIEYTQSYFIILRDSFKIPLSGAEIDYAHVDIFKKVEPDAAVLPENTYALMTISKERIMNEFSANEDDCEAVAEAIGETMIDNETIQNFIHEQGEEAVKRFEESRAFWELHSRRG